MTKRPKSDLKLKLVNFFGALGYFFCSLQWLWTAFLYFNFINAVVLFVSPNANKPIPKPTPTVPVEVNTSPLFMIFTATIVISMIALTLYVIFKMPSTLAKTSKKAVNLTATNVTQSVIQVQHKKDTKKSRLSINSTVMIFLKIIFVITPIILAVLSLQLGQKTIDYYIAVYVCLWLAGFCAISFVTQYILAYIMSIKRQDLV